MEIDDVFADEVNLLGVRIGQNLLKVKPLLAAVGAKRSQIADWRIQPDVEVFAGCIWNFNAEIRRIT